MCVYVWEEYLITKLNLHIKLDGFINYNPYLNTKTNYLSTRKNDKQLTCLYFLYDMLNIGYSYVYVCNLILRDSPRQQQLWP